MKFHHLIISILVLLSCEESNLQNSILNCENKQNLLSAPLDESALFNFDLSRDGQYDYIQSQFKKDICRGMFPFNGNYILDEGDTIKLLTVIERFCKDRVPEEDEEMMPCVLIRRKRICLISDDSVLIDNSFVKMSRFKDSIFHLTNEFFIKNKYRLIAFDLNWLNNTSEFARKSVLRSIVTSYIQRAELRSKEMFNLNLCDLSNEQLKELKRQFKLLISLEYPLALPPPPPVKFRVDEDDTTISNVLLESE